METTSVVHFITALETTLKPGNALGNEQMIKAKKIQNRRNSLYEK